MSTTATASVPDSTPTLSPGRAKTVNRANRVGRILAVFRLHFALGFGATRRDYYLGTILVLVAPCAGWAIVFGILAIIEEASNGWGVHDHMFSSIYFGDNGSLVRFWYVFLLMLFFAGLGLVAGALFVRWRTWGLIAFLAVITVLFVGTGAWIALTNSWVRSGGSSQALVSPAPSPCC